MMWGCLKIQHVGKFAAVRQCDRCVPRLGINHTQALIKKYPMFIEKGQRDGYYIIMESLYLG